MLEHVRDTAVVETVWRLEEVAVVVEETKEAVALHFDRMELAQSGRSSSVTPVNDEAKGWLPSSGSEIDAAGKVAASRIVERGRGRAARTKRRAHILSRAPADLVPSPAARPRIIEPCLQPSAVPGSPAKQQQQREKSRADLVFGKPPPPISHGGKFRSSRNQWRRVPSESGARASDARRRYVATGRTGQGRMPMVDALRLVFVSVAWRLLTGTDETDRSRRRAD